MSVNQKVLDAIELLAGVSVDKAGYDKTIQAQIISCQDAATGKYKCRYQDSIIYAFSSSIEIIYNKDDYVYILVPSNDMRKQKTILGATNGIKLNTKKEQDNYEIIGNNLVTNKASYQMKASSSTNNIILYTDNENNVTTTNDPLILDTNNDIDVEYFKEADAFMVKFDVKTSIPQTKQNQGIYGIKYLLDFYDNTASNNSISRLYTVNSDDIENPYQLPSKVTQSFIFKIDGKNFKAIRRITMFCRNFPNDTGTNNQIILSNFKIYGLKSISKQESEGIGVFFETPDGTIIRQNNGVPQPLQIDAFVKINGNKLTSDKTIKYYWGIEQTNIAPNSLQYNQYLGVGWRCLNESVPINNNIVEWIPSDGIFIYNFDTNLRSRYVVLRVAAVYNGKTYIKDITLYYKNLATDIVLESNDGTCFYYDRGTPKITCTVTGETGGTYTYYWGKEDRQGLFLTIGGNTNNTTIAVRDIVDYIKVKCSVYKTISSVPTFIGTASITLVNSLAKDELNMIEGWDGETVKIDNNSVLAPKIAAGKIQTKTADNGSSYTGFTGTAIGVITTNKNGTKSEKTGIFAYNTGIRTFFLNSKNGAAVFGAGTGRIVIDPSSKKALLYSTDFWQENNLDEDGIPESTNYLKNTTNGLKLNYDKVKESGMLIDFTAPAIYYGNGGFYVDKDGNMVANKGKIGGWTISTNTISAEKDGKTIKLDASNGKISGTNWALSATGGEIGGWTIGNGSISKSGITLGSGQIQLGNLKLYSSGAIEGTNWSITADGVATFKAENFNISKKTSEDNYQTISLSTYIQNEAGVTPTPV